MLEGAFLGAVFGFILSELKGGLYRYFDKVEVNEKLIPLIGKYVIKTKGNFSKHIVDAEITKTSGNIVYFKVQTKLHHFAEGQITFFKII